MGEVYRARDTNLDRNAAIKVLPSALAQDPERLARFEREAKVLAALNHPNIAQIYGVEQGALVMELVEGHTLPCPVPIESARNHAKQIAEALEYAHERGVIHRDLKPANVKVTPEGMLKLLDFGLAKAIEDPAIAPDNSDDSPTLTLGQTQLGVVMGTAAYMAPEQAAGAAVDRRADIWAFGAVLYEMLSGKRGVRRQLGGGHAGNCDEGRSRLARTAVRDARCHPQADPALPDQGSEAAVASHRRSAHLARESAG
jgi:serine/threonine-protein kinase